MTPGHPLPTDLTTPGDHISKTYTISFTLMGFVLTSDGDYEGDSEGYTREPKSTGSPYYSTTAKLDSNCVICLENFKQGDRCRVLPTCKHMFHDHCVDAWLNTAKRCPTCRTPHSPKEIISFERGMTVANVV
ncbi:hypothetical protein MRB53_014823 [Persea americana]|uniref:Uncharacterized protein n=1 Tax=Persea americana TaxID=3435 RepID=A0ACC2KC86_PERAE|nr:hypothetical protein MRB53_014823 [Persea americana]